MLQRLAYFHWYAGYVTRSMLSKTTHTTHPPPASCSRSWIVGFVWPPISQPSFHGGRLDHEIGLQTRLYLLPLPRPHPRLLARRKSFRFIHSPRYPTKQALWGCIAGTA
ncbi:unnamed protein product, partial [Ectocarpus sp. 8 AP-2014]